MIHIETVTYLNNIWNYIFTFLHLSRLIFIWALSILTSTTQNMHKTQGILIAFVNIQSLGLIKQTFNKQGLRFSVFVIHHC